jgi:anti-sigma B factor antagonist
MFEISQGEAGVVVFAGRLDAAQCAKAQAFLDAIEAPKEFDFAALEYISSAGLGVLLKTQKRVMGSSGRLKLINVNNHINDIFRYSGFDQIFEIQRAEG